MEESVTPILSIKLFFFRFLFVIIFIDRENVILIVFILLMRFWSGWTGMREYSRSVACKRCEAFTCHSIAFHRGENVTIAVIDTGIDYTHEEPC